MTAETIAQPAALQGLNGRTEIPSGHGDDAALNPTVVAAPGYMLYLTGRHNAVVQQVPIDPGAGYLDVIAALEQGRALANRYAPPSEQHPPSDRSIIAALRLALLDGYAREDRALDVVRAILEHAAPTDDVTKAANDAGVTLLVHLLKAGRLQAEVTPA